MPVFVALLRQQGMIKCQELGLTKSIGVSNFNQRQLQTLIDDSSVAPANLQVCVTVSFSLPRFKKQLDSVAEFWKLILFLHASK